MQKSPIGQGAVQEEVVSPVVLPYTPAGQEVQIPLELYWPTGQEAMAKGRRRTAETYNAVSRPIGTLGREEGSTMAHKISIIRHEAKNATAGVTGKDRRRVRRAEVAVCSLS